MNRPRHTTTQSHGKRPQSLGQLAVGQQLGRYQVLAELASGGMAVVHVASAQGAAGFERLVALKVLHAHLACEEEFIKMFLDEARLAAGIRHPNVVSTIDISDSLETGYFLVMEYVEGDHLGALLSGAHKRGERLPLPVVMRIVIDALAGLGAAHELRDGTGKPLHLVHRDVSPHNVMVGCDGVSRLTDFGVAKAEDRLTQTRHGEVKGKLSYMAPEQASSGASDRRADLFSVGIILWEAVTGRRLFRGETVSATLNKLLSNKIAPPSAIDPALAPLDPLLRKALAHDPADRFNSAEEFSDAIEQVAREVGGVASWRHVSDAVNEYADEKLARERKLISAAKLVLQTSRTNADLAESGESVLKAPGPIHTLEAVGGTRAEPSGIFSNMTAPGRRVRNTRTAEGALPVSAPPPTPSGPAPMGDRRATRRPASRPGLPSVEVSAAAARSQTPPPVPRAVRRSGAHQSRPSRSKRLAHRAIVGVGACALLGFAAWTMWGTPAANPDAGFGAPIAPPTALHSGDVAVPDTSAHLVAPRPTHESPTDAAWPPSDALAVIAEVNTPPVPTRVAPTRAHPTRPRSTTAPTRSKRPRRVASASSSTRNATAAESANSLFQNPYRRP